MKMEFSVGTGRNEAIYEVPSLAKTAEESGFSHITFVDQQNISRDVYAMMALAAINTHRIKIGHGVTVPLIRHPSVTANATATIDELSGGRVFLGIGIGGNALRSMGVKQPPMKEFKEEVEFIKRYMSGQEAEFKGARMHSEWVRHPVPVYIASSHSVKTCQLGGEIGDGVIIVDAHPEIVKWRLELIERGAVKSGRDPSKIDVWVRTEIFIAGSKEEARKEAASYAASAARNRYWYLQKKTPEAVQLGELMERVEPGIINEMKRIYDNWDEYQHEKTDAAHARLASQRVIDFFHLTGKPEDICDRIYALGKLGVKNISTTVFTVIDKKGMMRKIGDEIMPHFRN